MSEFPPHKQGRNGLYPWCRLCKRADDAAYRQRNREKINAGSRKYYSANKALHAIRAARWKQANLDKVAHYEAKRRAAKRNCYSENFEYRIFEGEPCVYCGNQGEARDHIRPLALGGLHTLENLATTCKSCNSSKGKKLLTEWDQERVRFAISWHTGVAVEYERQLEESSSYGV